MQRLKKYRNEIQCRKPRMACQTCGPGARTGLLRGPMWTTAKGRNWREGGHKSYFLLFYRRDEVSSIISSVIICVAFNAVCLYIYLLFCIFLLYCGRWCYIFMSFLSGLLFIVWQFVNFLIYCFYIWDYKQYGHYWALSVLNKYI